MPLRIVRSVLAFAAAGVVFGSAAQAQSIGSASLVEYWAYRTPANADRQDLFLNDNVFLDDLIATVDQGGAQIRFIDGTTVTIGRGSEIVLDSFVYNPSTSTGEFVAGVSRGAFRFVSGNIPNQTFSIETPTTVIGIRGTIFDLEVGPTGTRVDVIDGLVTVTPTCDPQPVEVAAGQSALFRTRGCDVVFRTPTPIEALSDVVDQFPGPGSNRHDNGDTIGDHESSEGGGSDSGNSGGSDSGNSGGA